MTIRVLPLREWDRVAPLLAAEFGDALPDPTRARIFVAEEAGEIRAFCVAQFILHIEPTWISPSERGNLGLARSLGRYIQKVLGRNNAVCTTSSERVVQIMKLFGFELREGVKVLTRRRDG